MPSPDPHPTLRSLERRYVLLSALRWLPVGLLVPVFVVLPTARDIPLAAVGPMLAAYSAMAILLELPTGGFADRFGRRRVHVGASAIMVPAFVLFGLAETITAFVVSILIAGTNRALLSGPIEAWFVDQSHEVDREADLDRAYARAESVSALAVGAGALLTAVLPQLVSLPESGPGLIAPALPALLAAVAEAVHLVAAFVLMRPETRHEADASGAPPLTIRQTIVAAVQTARGPVLRRVLVAELVLAFAMVAGEQLTPADLVEMLGERDAASTFGFLAAIGFVAVSLGARLTPALVARLGARRAYASVVATVAVVLAVPALRADVAVLVVAYLLVYFALGTQGPLRSTLVHARVTSSQRATVLSVTSLVFQAGGLLASLTLLPLFGAAGRTTAWLAAAAVVGVGAVVLGLPTRDQVAPDLDLPSARPGAS